jgi:hypothetical protein
MKCEYCENEFVELKIDSRFCCETHKEAFEVLQSDHIMCCECKKIFDSVIQSGHVKSCSSLTFTQYKEKHKYIHSKSGFEKASRGQKKRFADSDNLAKHTMLMQECHRRPESHDKRCKIQKESHNTLEYLERARKAAIECQNRPEVSLKKSITTTIVMNRSEMIKKCSEIQLVSQNRPGVADKKRASLEKTWTEEKKREHSKVISEAMNRPEVVTLMSNVMSVVMRRPEVRKNCSEATLRTLDEGKDPWYLNAVTGYYRDVYFESFYEYRAMKAFDILKKEWCRAHLNIRYLGSDEQNHVYRPDFIVNGNEIWETKGFDSEITQLKAKGARKFVQENNDEYTSYRLLFDRELTELEKEAALTLEWTFERYQVQLNKEYLYYKSESDRKKLYHRRQKVA